MSKLQSLAPSKLADIKRLVLAGTGPKKISDDLGVSISVVHKYKAQWKEEGLEFASIRGQRTTPATSIVPPKRSRPSGTVAPAGTVSTQNGPQGTTKIQQGTSMKGHNNFIVNGTSIHIANNAKSVTIDKSDKDNSIVMRIDI